MKLRERIAARRELIEWVFLALGVALFVSALLKWQRTEGVDSALRPMSSLYSSSAMMLWGVSNVLFRRAPGVAACLLFIAVALMILASLSPT